MSNFEIVNSDPFLILEDIKKIYKDKTKTDLIKADPRYMDYEVLAYFVSCLKAEMNDTARQNYIQFARGKRLDLKGELFGTRGERGKKEKAKTTMRCYVQGTHLRKIIIPQETRFIKDDYIFESVNENYVEIGEIFIDVIVECQQEGFVPVYKEGEITEIVDLYDYYEKCENVTKVVGGTDGQNDNDYKVHLTEITESFSTAGPEKSYKLWAKKASSLIKDIHVISPAPCYIDIYILGENGTILGEEIKNEVLEIVNSKEVRPQGDRVSVKDPSIENYNLDISYFLYEGTEAKALEIDRSIKNMLNEYTEQLGSKIGASINTQDIVSIIKNCGARRVVIREPEDRKISETSVAVCQNFSVIMAGVDK